MLMGPPFREESKPEVDLRVYSTKAVEVSSGSRSSCAEAADPAAGFACGYLSAVMSVRAPFSWRFVSMPGLAPVKARVSRSSRAAGASPREAGGVGPSTPGNDALATPDADAPVISGDDSPATPDAHSPVILAADAPVILADTSVIPENGDPTISSDAAPGSGWPFGALLGISITLFSFSENQG